AKRSSMAPPPSGLHTRGQSCPAQPCASLRLPRETGPWGVLLCELDCLSPVYPTRAVVVADQCGPTEANINPCVGCAWSIKTLGGALRRGEKNCVCIHIGCPVKHCIQDGCLLLCFALTRHQANGLVRSFHFLRRLEDFHRPVRSFRDARCEPGDVKTIIVATGFTSCK